MSKGFVKFCIFSEYFEVLGQRPYGVERLFVAGEVVEREVDVKPVFPLSPDDGHGLYFRQVDVVEGEDGEHLRQAALRVGQAEDERRLVDALAGGEPVAVKRVGHDQEAGEVALVGLDALGQDVQTVDLGRQPAADGGMPREVVLGYLLGAARRVVLFDEFHARVGLEKLAALHQGHGVRVNLAYVVEGLARQSGQYVRDAQLVFPHDVQIALAQQLVVLQQAAGDGILDGDDAQQGAVECHAVEHLGKGGTGDGLDFLLAEVGAGGGFVVTAGYALYGDSLLHRSKIKKSRSVVERDFTIRVVVLFYILLIA